MNAHPSRSDERSAAVRQLVMLTDEQREALSSLLDGAQRLYSLSRSSQMEGSEFTAQALLGYADRVAHDSCRLAGMPLGPLAERAVQYELVAVEVEQHTEKLWSTFLSTAGERISARYSDGPTRRVAVAMGLVLLARTVLEGEPASAEGITVERGLEQKLAAVMDEFDDSLCPPLPPRYVPEGYHLHGPACPLSTANPAGICNCSLSAVLDEPEDEYVLPDEREGAEPSFHGSGGVD